MFAKCLAGRPGTADEIANVANFAMIGLFGDDPNDYMAKCGVKWLHKRSHNKRKAGVIRMNIMKPNAFYIKL